PPVSVRPIALTEVRPADSPSVAAGAYETDTVSLHDALPISSQPVAVTVNGDTKSEPNETFFVNLSNPINATISDNQGAGMIVNGQVELTLELHYGSQKECDRVRERIIFTESVSSARYVPMPV